MNKRKSLLILVLLAVLSITLFGCTTQTEKSFNNAYITLDINPSIEIITGDDGLVEQVNALNDDAQTLLVDTDFVGKTVDETVEAILELATQLGYIDYDQENAILITAATEDEKEVVELEETIADKVNKFVNERDIKLDLLKASLEATEDLKAKAEELNVSVGKLKLMLNAVAFDSTLTLESTATMSVRDLNKIIKQSRNEVKDFFNEEVKSNYLDQKNEFNRLYFLDRVTLINAAIQTAENTVFTDLIGENTVTAQEIKDLYQAYLTELVNVEIPTEEEIIEEQETVKLQIEALQAQLDTLQDELRTLTNELRKQKGNAEEFSTIVEEIKTKVIAARELSDQINELRKDAKVSFKDTNRGHKWNKNNVANDNDDKKSKWNKGLKDYEVERELNVLTYLKEVTKKYQKSFEELGINFEDLEELFKSQIEDQLEVLFADYQGQLQVIHDELKDYSTIIKDQIKEENKVLRDVWKR